MKPTHKNLYAILAMLGLLAISFGLDRLIMVTKEYVSRNSKGVVTMILLSPLSTILITFAALLLFWFTINQMKKNYLVITVFLIFGVIIELLVLSKIQPLGSSLLFLQPFLLPGFNLFFAGVLVMVVGS